MLEFIGRWLCVFLLVLTSRASHAAETFRVATYNLENYAIEAAGNRPVKPLEARAKAREFIRALKPDVIALQEVVGSSALAELRSALKAEGLDFPHAELVTGWDTNIQIAVLSRLPILASHPHTNEVFLLYGRRFRVTRGFAEIDFQAGSRYKFTLFAAHLKSRRTATEADERDIREQEAGLLRALIDARLARDPEANIIVAGDLNDTKDSPSTRAILGRGRNMLVDTRPAEQNGDRHHSDKPRFSPRDITWTHFFGKEDTYSRIDYLLLSPGMAREWQAAETYVLAAADWGLASDHRPVVAAFTAEER
ncbi:MAG TPA: endonuclease/exonuclease/phosphatase family protein [Verrucomicrobiae bacterium]|nr:endonuclease/exonuclease/phosphatase family protein [Verrucomicrobiae bacterium]